MLIELAAVIKFDKLEKRTQDEVRRMHEQARPRNQLPMTQNEGFLKPLTCNLDKAQQLYPHTIDDSLLKVNYYRWLVGVDGYKIYNDPESMDRTMKCSQTIAINGKLSHTPIQDGFTCVDKESDQACGGSNLGWIGRSFDTYGQPVSNHIDAFMEDTGKDNAQVGHRRWVIYPLLGNVSFGKTFQYGAMYIGGPKSTNYANLNAPFVAFPAPGPFPISMMYPRWSFSLPNKGLKPNIDYPYEIVADGTKIKSGVARVVGKTYGDTALVFDLGNQLSTAKKAQSITVKVTGNGNDYVYTIKPFNADDGLGCICTICPNVNDCIPQCPRGANIAPVGDMGSNEPQRKWLYDLTTKMSKDNRELYLYIVGAPNIGAFPIRIEPHDLQRCNITVVGAPYVNYYGAWLTISNQNENRKDPQYLMRNTWLKLINAPIRRATWYNGDSYWGTPEVMNLEVDWFSAANLMENDDLGDGCGEIKIHRILKINTLDFLKKITYQKNGRIVFHHVNGSSFQLWSNKKIDKAQTLDELKSYVGEMQIFTENNNLEINAEEEYDRDMQIHVVFESNHGNKLITQTGNWSSVRPDSIKAQVEMGKLNVDCSNAISPPTIEITEANPNAYPDEQKSALNSGVGAAIVIVFVVVIVSTVSGIVLYKKKYSVSIEQNTDC